MNPHQPAMTVGGSWDKGILRNKLRSTVSGRTTHIIRIIFRPSLLQSGPMFFMTFRTLSQKQTIRIWSITRLECRFLFAPDRNPTDWTKSTSVERRDTAALSNRQSILPVALTRLGSIFWREIFWRQDCVLSWVAGRQFQPWVIGRTQRKSLVPSLHCIATQYKTFAGVTR